MDEHKDFIIFYILGRVECILELRYHFYHNSRWRGPTYRVIREYNVALNIRESQ